MAHNEAMFNDLYADKSFDKDMFGFYVTEGRVKNKKVTDALLKSIATEGFDTIQEWQFSEYNPVLQNKTFLASTVLYHMHSNSVDSPNDYIGFLEYDLSLNLGDKSFCNQVKNIMGKHEGEQFIIFPSIRHTLNTLLKDTKIKIGNENWLQFFLKDYNKRYGTDYEYKSFVKEHGKCLIPTQQSFITDTESYKDISKYVHDVITEECLNKGCSPRPSTVMERFIGVYMFLHSKKILNEYKIPLTHKHSSGGKY